MTTEEATSYYYLGGKLVATKVDDELIYVHQDHLGSTSVSSDTDGAATSSIKYFPFGSERSTTGTLPTDKLFTGQRRDSTGLYYYNARYYDREIGRFISADSFVQWSTGFDTVSRALTVNTIPQGNYPSVTLQAPVNSQNLNRYSYTLNNPLKYTDPFGWWTGSLSFNLNASIGFEGFIGISLYFDGHGNIAITNDHPREPGGSSCVGVGAAFKVVGTVEDNISDVISKDVYTADLTWEEVIQFGPGIVANDQRIIGGSFLVGLGSAFPPVALTGDFPTSDVVLSGSLENFPENAFYALSNMISSEAAYYYDYFNDFEIDYGYDYDWFYSDFYQIEYK